MERINQMDDSLRASHMRTLLNIYRFYERNYPEQRIYWLRQQGQCVILYQDSLQKAFFPTLRQCLGAQPDAMPAMFLEHFSERLLRTIESGEGSDTKWIADFCLLENIWLNLSSWNPGQVPQAQTDRLRLAEALQAQLPNCQSLRQQFSSPLSRDLLRPEDYRYIYTCLRLNGCTDGGFRDSVLTRYPTVAKETYAYRIAALEAVDRGLHLEALPWLERSTEVERNPYFRAQDFLRLAELYRQISNFRTARLYADYANEALPDWGEPYLFLAEMVVQSGPFCNFTPLEQKAIHWLAIDYCEMAMNRNPSLEAAAIKRIQTYEKGMPTEDEVLFYGFQLGDSFPLSCWMETATRVRY
ncbi:MAG: hypothetical protein AAFQ68_02075 [Bacteroidota bacterium]